MKKYLAALALSLAVISAQSPAQAAGNGRNVAKGVAIGLGIGLVAAAVIASSRSGHGATYHYSSSSHRRYEDRCSIWRRACRDGSDRACYKFDTRC